MFMGEIMNGRPPGCYKTLLETTLDLFLCILSHYFLDLVTEILYCS